MTFEIDLIIYGVTALAFCLLLVGFVLYMKSIISKYKDDIIIEELENDCDDNKPRIVSTVMAFNKECILDFIEKIHKCIEENKQEKN